MEKRHELPFLRTWGIMHYSVYILYKNYDKPKSADSNTTITSSMNIKIENAHTGDEYRLLACLWELYGGSVTAL